MPVLLSCMCVREKCRLERQVVGTVAISGCGSGWERSLCAFGRGTERSTTGHGLRPCGTGLGSCRIDVLYIPCTNVVEPAVIILMGVNVKRHRDFLATFDIELSQTVGAEYIEHHLARILLVGLNDKRLRLPLATR